MASAAHMNSQSASFRDSDPDNTSYHAKDLRSQVRQALEDGDRHLVVDCEGWNRFDLSMLSSLIQCAAACREHGASFEVREHVERHSGERPRPSAGGSTGLGGLRLTRL